MGEGDRSSIAANAISRTAAAASDPAMCALSQPSGLPRTSAKVARKQAVPNVISPGRSCLRFFV
jgi:hypothetical protein